MRIEGDRAARVDQQGIDFFQFGQLRMLRDGPRERAQGGGGRIEMYGRRAAPAGQQRGVAQRQQQRSGAAGRERRECDGRAGDEFGGDSTMPTMPTMATGPKAGSWRTPAMSSTAYGGEAIASTAQRAAPVVDRICE